MEGTVAKWYFKAGDTISQRKAKELPALSVTEPCKHGMQLGGLCCLCGKDMTRCVSMLSVTPLLGSTFLFPVSTIPVSQTRRAHLSK